MASLASLAPHFERLLALPESERKQALDALALDADARARLEQRLGDVAADEAAAAEQGDQPVRLYGHEHVP